MCLSSTGHTEVQTISSIMRDHAKHHAQTLTYPTESSHKITLRYTRHKQIPCSQPIPSEHMVQYTPNNQQNHAWTTASVHPQPYTNHPIQYTYQMKTENLTKVPTHILTNCYTHHETPADRSTFPPRDHLSN